MKNSLTARRKRVWIALGWLSIACGFPDYQFVDGHDSNGLGGAGSVDSTAGGETGSGFSTGGAVGANGGAAGYRAAGGEGVGAAGCAGSGAAGSAGPGAAGCAGVGAAGSAGAGAAGSAGSGAAGSAGSGAAGSAGSGAAGSAGSGNTAGTGAFGGGMAGEGGVPLGGGGTAGSGGAMPDGGSGGVEPVPTCTDGQQNGDETDKDCGGPNCGACEVYQNCSGHSDCLTQNCEPIYGQCYPSLSIVCSCSDCVNASVSTQRVSFEVKNDGSAPIPADQILIRYFIQRDQNEAGSCEAAGTTGGCNNVIVSNLDLNPVGDRADRFVQFGFNSAAGNFEAGSWSGQFSLRIADSFGARFNPLGDFSAYPRSAADICDHIAIYRKVAGGPRLMWGFEPESVQ